MQNCKILQGDCLNLMKKLPDKSIQLILCDLPFGVTQLEWDKLLDLLELWEQYRRIMADNGVIVLFCTLPFGFELIKHATVPFRYDLVWSKNTPTGMSYAKTRPMRYHENIFVFYNGICTYNKILKDRVGEHKECYNGYSHYCGTSNQFGLFQKQPKQYDPDKVNPSTVLDFKVVANRSKEKIHPTQKPVELLEWLIKTYTNENELVLDNCAGSMSTGIAAISSNRNCILMEQDEKYYLAGLERVKLFCAANNIECNIQTK